jgi:D-alanine-D-alanine ligase
MRIAVLFGGTSEEREVSVASAAQIIPALSAAGHEVVAVDTARGRLPTADTRRLLEFGVASAPPTEKAIAEVRANAVALNTSNIDVQDVDVVFLALHGGAGEDGRLQAMLDLAGLPYTGSSHIASAAAMDKDLSKRLFRAALVPTPDWLMAPVSAGEVARTLGWPAIVKPNKQGSTVGLTLVKSASDLGPAIAAASQFDNEVMVEHFIAGREFTVGILEEAALPVGEIIAPGDIFDYEAKYQPRVAREVFPADIPPGEARRIQEYALRAHRALKLGAYSRIDFRRDGNGEYWCLEANALPGMTATSLLPQAARAAGIEFPELLDRICRGAVKPIRR